MRYANHECAGCGLILPANQLTTVSDRVETGTSQHERYSKTYSTYSNSGRTRHYATRAKRLCRRCANKRIRNGFLGLCGAAGVLWILTHGGSSNSHLATHSGSRARQSVIDTAQTSGDAPPVDIVEGQQPSRDDSVSAPAQANDDGDLARQIIAAPQGVERVGRAIEKAGANGAAVRWHVHGVHGYAVPSAAGGDGCRMVQVSIDEGEQAQPTKWCPNSLAAPE